MIKIPTTSDSTVEEFVANLQTLNEKLTILKEKYKISGEL
jgi:hypothetical protein